MNKQAMVSQIQRESERLEDRLLSNILAQVPSIVRREMHKIQETEGKNGATDKLQELSHQIEDMKSTNKTAFRRIDEYIKARLDGNNQLNESRKLELEGLIAREGAQIRADLSRSIKLDVDGQLESLKRDILQQRHFWLPREIEELVTANLKQHAPQNPVMGTEQSLAPSASTTDPLTKKILAALTSRPPNGTRLSESDKEIYAVRGLCKRIGLDSTSVRNRLESMVSCGLIIRRAVYFGGHYGIAYWNEQPEPIGHCHQQDKPRPQNISLQSVLAVLPSEIDPVLKSVNWSSPYTIFGVAQRLGYNVRTGTTLRKIESILNAAVKSGKASKKTIQLDYGINHAKLGQAYWRV